jgi:streptogramin lyase
MVLSSLLWTWIVAGVGLLKCLPVRAVVAQGEEIMKRSAMRSRLAALVTACLGCLCLLSLSSATTWAKGVTIKEFPVPTSGSAPDSITAGPDGNLWFTEENGNQIGRITPKGTIKEFPIGSVTTPFGITAGPDGNLWFTTEIGNQIGRITTGGSLTGFMIPTASSGAEGITAGPAHTRSVWFTEFAGNQIGEITT